MIKTILFSAIKPIVGGQAVIDGVAMRLHQNLSIALRKPDKTIAVYEKDWISFSAGIPFLKWPMLRGMVLLFESIYNGTLILQFSADQALGIQEKNTNLGPKKFDWALIVTVATCLLLGIIFFKFMPHVIVYIFSQWLEKNQNIALPVTSIWFHLLDGGVKIILFITYIVVISTIKDVKNVFKYHGAEHKSVHLFEKNKSLTVESAKLESRIHPRCGTSLMLSIIIISILLFSLILPNIPIVSSNIFMQNLFLMWLKIPLMLPVAGIAYEIQKFAIENQNRLIAKIFIIPGAFMQKLTTKEPTDDQLEVALAALKCLIKRNNVT